MKKKFVKLVLVMLVVFLIGGVCSDVDAASQKMTLFTGQSKRIMSKSASKSYRITTSNYRIATISKGNIKARRQGTVRIVAVHKKTKAKKVYNITVVNKLKKLKVSVKHKKDWAGEKDKIIISKSPASSRESIIYKTGNSKIATVSNGYVVMKGPGRTYITAQTRDGRLKSTFWITVYGTPNLNFREGNPHKIEVKSKYQLHLNSYDYPKGNIKYTSNHKDVISVDKNGKVTANRPGNAIITATGLDGKKASIKVISKSTNGQISKATLDHYHAYKYDNVMIVAHPDDETLWGGAHLGKGKYFVVCLTNGFNLTRANEYRAILRYTGNEGIILNYPDSQDSIRDDWSDVRPGMIKDLERIIGYKNWKSIVTYNPDGVTGHIHHILTYEEVYEVTEKYNKLDKLYYFGPFYKKNNIPADAERISDSELKIKLEEIKLYKSVLNNIYTFWYHMLPYEKFIFYKDWGVESEDLGTDPTPVVPDNVIELNIPVSSIEIKGVSSDTSVILEPTSVVIKIKNNDNMSEEDILSDLNPSIDVAGLPIGEAEASLVINNKYSLVEEVKIPIEIELLNNEG